MKILDDLCEHLSGMNVECQLCGGYAIDNPNLYFDNICCYKDGADFVVNEKVDEPFKYMKFINREQTELDFIEVMFNKVYDNVFYYLKHPKIIMDMNEAVIKEDKLNILAPEIILLYKSRNYTNCDYQHDFDVVINKLEKDRYDWFINAMNIAYPNGHPWIKEIA